MEPVAKTFDSLPSLTRRKIMTHALAGIAATLAGAPVLAASDDGFSLMNCDESQARQLIGTHFQFVNPATETAALRSAEATLVAVESLANSALNGPAGKGETKVSGFMLEFLVSESTVMPPSDLCQVLHAQLGTFEMFLTTGKNNKGQHKMLAVFTRL